MTDTALAYLNNMDAALGAVMNNPCSIYFGIEGHKRLARECGYALNDFCESDRAGILSASYGKLYVKHCNLKPILDAKEWMELMMSQVA